MITKAEVKAQTAVKVAVSAKQLVDEAEAKIDAKLLAEYPAHDCVNIFSDTVDFNQDGVIEELQSRYGGKKGGWTISVEWPDAYDYGPTFLQFS